MSPDRDVVLIKEGFSWAAFVFTALWALWHRMWLWAVILICGMFAVEVVLEMLEASPLVATALWLGTAGLMGAFGNDILRAHLDRRGYYEAGPVAALDRDAALRRYFDLNPDRIGGQEHATSA
jgi:Protein of unknown function (DUF2628)